MGDFTLRDMMRRRKGNQKDEGPGWRERVAALRYVPPLIRLVWQTHRGYTITMIALRLVRAFIPVATLWIGKLIIDAVVAMRESTPDFKRLWQLVTLEIIVVLAGEALARTSAL
ncbi:MAG TPA: ABC transporter ATP-binding protein, partial [Blastocatellia bacterium]